MVDRHHVSVGQTGLADGRHPPILLIHILKCHRIYSGTSDKGPSEIGTTSLQKLLGTLYSVTSCSEWCQRGEGGGGGGGGEETREERGTHGCLKM